MNVQRKKVLVLNKSWVAVRIVTLEKAITLLFSEYKNGEPKAKIIEENTYQTFTWDEWSKLELAEGVEGIHSSHAVYRIPEIIQLTRYNKIPNQKMTFSRNALYKRDEGKCMYCGTKLDLRSATIDHLTPKSHGGLSSWTNTAISCRSCNFKKRDRTPEKAGMKLLKQPTVPSHSLVSLDIKESGVKSWNNFV